MAFCDFVVKHDFEKEEPIDLTKKILYSVIIKRLKAHKPCVIFISGESGEGKSISSLRLQELLMEIQGLSIDDHIDDINVYTPLEYPKKLNALLFEKELKKVNIICMHEAREIVKAKLWYSFLNQSISDVNAMSRSIKRICTIIISQFIRDVSNDIRYTLNFYMSVRRPKGKAARLYIHQLWKDDRDLEKPKLRKRKLSGYILDKNGRYQRFVPTYLEIKKPRKELIEQFEKRDFDAKSGIIKKKINLLIKEMEQDIGVENKKVDLMVEYYSKNADNLTKLGSIRKKRFCVNKQFKSMHDLNDIEVKRFEIRMYDQMKKEGFIENE